MSILFYQHSSTSNAWSYNQKIYTTYRSKRNWIFPEKYLHHTQEQGYLSLGFSTQQLLLPGKILPATLRSSNGFPPISSHCQHLHGILWKTIPRPWMPHTYPLVEKIWWCIYCLPVLLLPHWHVGSTLGGLL